MKKSRRGLNAKEKEIQKKWTENIGPFITIQKFTKSVGGSEDDQNFGEFLQKKNFGILPQEVFKFEKLINERKDTLQGNKKLSSSSGKGKDDYMHRQTYLESNIKQNGKKNTISERHERHKNSEGLERIVKEKRFSDRRLKIVKEKKGKEKDNKKFDRYGNQAYSRNHLQAQKQFSK